MAHTRDRLCRVSPVHGGADQNGGSATSTDSTRRRAIAVARQLAVEGVTGTVRMRDVARVSGVPEHELYRHFSSRDHLMVLAQQDWIRDALERDPLPDGDGLDGGDRVAEVIHRSLMATAAAPRFVTAVLASQSSVDPAVRCAHQTSNREVARILREAVGPELVEVDTYIELLGVAWLGVLSAWSLGNMTIEQADEVAQRTARLLYRSLLMEQQGADEPSGPRSGPGSAA